MITHTQVTLKEIGATKVTANQNFYLFDQVISSELLQQSLPLLLPYVIFP